MTDAGMIPSKNLERMTKAELARIVQSLRAAGTQSWHTMQQQSRLLDLSYDAIFVWELGGAIQYWNPAATELYGWTSEEARGKISHELLQAIHPEGWAQVEEELLLNGHWYGELLHQTSDGRRIVVDSRHVLVREDDGRMLVLETNRDLTARKQAEEAMRKSETLKQAILNSVTAHIAVLDQTGNIIDTNVAWKRFARENGGEAFFAGLGENYLEVCRKAFGQNAFEAQAALAGILAVLEGSQSIFTLEYPCHSPSDHRWFLMTVSPLAGEQGGAVISHINITERKQAEVSLRESEQRLSLALAAASMGAWSWEIPVNRVFWSPECYELTGVEELDQTLEGFTRLVHPEDVTRMTNAFKEAIATHSLYEVEFRIIRPDGQTLWVSNYGRAIYDDSGQPLRLMGVAMDITERKRAEQALRGSEARMGGIINSAMDAMISVNDQQRIVLFNAAAEKMFGYPAEEVMGQPLARFIPARFRSTHEQHIQRFGATGETTRSMGALNAVSGVRRNGEEFPIEASISQIEVRGQKLFTVILRDITERVRSSERLIEQAALLDQSHEAILVHDLDGRIRYWSRGAERLYGWSAEEAVGRLASDLHYRKDNSPLAAATQLTTERGKWNGELRQWTRDGREVIVEGRWTLVRDVDGNPKNILAINTDITEKKKLEANFLRAQRLESIGTLASGIAHDLNNILSPIMMGAQMLQMKLPDEQSQRLLSLMQSNANRGAEMIKQVLSFARGISGNRVVLQSKHLIREVIRIAEETFPKSVRIEQQLAEELWTINADATQLLQVLLNLCINARDAMPEGGILTLTAENRPLDKLYAQMLKGAAPGNFVVITVADTGLGIPSDIIDRIFDPFFTTKEPGQGTGLGLATAQGIVATHGGFITVESKPGLGAKFSIFLPSNEIASQQTVRESTLELPCGAGELILVVDDEAAVREMTSATLEAFGYRALTADNGATALSLYVSHRNEVCTVIIDLMMPVMDGIATIRALRKLNPDLCVIATSGLTDPVRADELRRLRVDDLLEKPYNAESLLNTVAKVLGKRSPSGDNL